MIHKFASNLQEIIREAAAAECNDWFVGIFAGSAELLYANLFLLEKIHEFATDSGRPRGATLGS